MYQLPYTHQLHPNHGSAPPQVMVDAHGSPLPYETSRSVFNHGQPIPMGYHGYCNYGYVPGFYNLPYPHYPPPPPFYYHGAYPSLPPMYPDHYVPPPHYQMDQPRYEFDKNQMPGHHCCGCPGHQCRTREDRPLEIEHQEPYIEKIPSKSLLPAEPRSPMYPLVLVPQEDMNSKEQRNELEPKQNEQHTGDSRTENNVKAIGKRNQNQMEGETNQFPFPIFWIPCKCSEEGKKHHKKPDLLVTKGDTSTVKPKEREIRVGIDDAPAEMKKISHQKLIPVKQVGENEQRDKEIVKEKIDKENKSNKSIAVTPVGENTEKGDKEIVKGNGESEKKLLENPNKSKLPPVCLRVEPLRKKRNGSNGISRSPSPKRDENKSSSCAQNMRIEHKSTITEREAIEVRGGETKERRRGDERVEGSKGIKENEEIAVEAKNPEVTSMLEKTDKEEINISDKTDKEEKNLLGKLEKENCELETKAQKKLSEVEAAIKIQSAYRGFEVRRWEQLKKLKQISEIREKMAEIKIQINALEASAHSSSYDKQRVVIGEMIMSLLLKLDTIQGLHPTVREIRKSVAKELASLQEQIDSMGKKSSELSSTGLMEDPVGGEEKAKIDREISVAIVSEVVEKEISEEAEDGAEPVSSVCELKDKEGAKEDITLDCVNLGDEKQTSVELVGEIQGDMSDSERMMTEINDTECKLDGVFGSETKVSSCVGDALTDQPGGFEGEIYVDEDKHNEKISMEELLGPDFKPLDMIGTAEAITEVSQESLDESKGNSLTGNLEDDIKSEMGIESGSCHRVEEEKISGEVQGGEYKCLDDFAKSFTTNDDCIEKHETGVQVPEDQEGDGARIVTNISFESEAEPDQPSPEPLEKHVEEDPKSEEIHGEGEALKPEQMKKTHGEEKTSNMVEMKEGEIELNIAPKEESHELLENKHVEINNVESNENVKLVETVKVHGEADSSKPEEMDGTELDMALTEENHDSLENKYVVETESSKNMESIETENFEKQAENGSEMGVGNDTKLEEENEKLRKMVVKLVEAGEEQLNVISSLSGRVKDLEIKMVRKKKPKMRRRIRVGSQCIKPLNHSVKECVKGSVAAV